MYTASIRTTPYFCSETEVISNLGQPFLGRDGLCGLDSLAVVGSGDGDRAAGVCGGAQGARGGAQGEQAGAHCASQKPGKTLSISTYQLSDHKVGIIVILWNPPGTEPHRRRPRPQGADRWDPPS